MKIFAFGLVLCAATAACAQDYVPFFIEKGGCIVKVMPLFTSGQSPYNLQLFQPANDPYRWDLTPDAVPLGSSAKQTTIRATLHQFDTYDEEITFKNLDLMPIPASNRGKTIGSLHFESISRFLNLKEAQSITTPSGITVTLPAQQVKDFIEMFFNFNGNANALFIRVEVAPKNNLGSPLPDSPLFRKHGRAVKISLLVKSPNSIFVNPVTEPGSPIGVSLPNLKTATRLDELTLIVRQRVDLKSVPVEFAVPGFKPQPQNGSVK